MRHVLTIVILFISFFSISQAGTNDPTFNILDDCSLGNDVGFDGESYISINQADGKILIGGNFISFNGKNVNGLVRSNVDGSIDTSFHVELPYGVSIHTICLQNDGKILTGGYFSTCNGITQNNIVRLNIDGSIDTSFHIGFGFNNVVRKISCQVDGKIIVGGGFTSYNGISKDRILRLNSDGSIDLSFSNEANLNNTVITICNQSDGKLLLGGEFTMCNGLNRSRICRLNNDGTLDNTFDPGSGFDNIVNTISVQTDGKIIVGGEFLLFNEINKRRIARLNSNGTLDQEFNSGSGFSAEVYSTEIQPNGKILVGGNFSWYNDSLSVRIARLNQDGSLDNLFNTGFGFNFLVSSVSLQSNNKILVNGWFSSFNGTTRNGITMLRDNGQIDTTIFRGTGFDGSINSMVIQPDNKIIVAGAFTQFNGILRNRIVRLNVDGTVDYTFNVGSGFSHDVLSLALQPDGKILVGGAFYSYDKLEKNTLVRLNYDGSLDTNFNVLFTIFESVNCIQVLSNEKILIGGDFTTINGISVNRLARLNNDGSIDSSFTVGIGFDQAVNSISIQLNGKIIVGGNFNTCQGISRKKILRLNENGTIDLSFNSGFYDYNTVYSTKIQADGKILIGGNFNSYYNEFFNSSLLRLKIDGSLDTNFFIGNSILNGYVKSILVLPNEKILVGGNFTSQNNLVLFNLNGTVDTFYEINNNVNAISTQSDGNIIIAGLFTKNSNTCRNKIARLFGECIIYTESFVISECDFYHWPENNQNYSTSGVFTYFFNSQNDCDLIKTLNLTINSSSYSIDSVIALNSFTWPLNGLLYTQSGTYYGQTLNQFGCDSLVTLYLFLDFAGLSDIEKEHSFFPNPVSNELTVKGEWLSPSSFDILDMQGRIVISGKLYSSEETIDVSSLKTGTYIFKLNDSTQKIVKL